MTGRRVLSVKDRLGDGKSSFKVWVKDVNSDDSMDEDLGWNSSRTKVVTRQQPDLRQTMRRSNIKDRLVVESEDKAGYDPRGRKRRIGWEQPYDIKLKKNRLQTNPKHNSQSIQDRLGTKDSLPKEETKTFKVKESAEPWEKKLAMPRMGMVADLVEKKVSAKERLHGQEGKEIIRREVINPAVKPKEIVRQRKSPPITEIIEVVEEEEDEDDIEDESNHIIRTVHIAEDRGSAIVPVSRFAGRLGPRLEEDNVSVKNLEVQDKLQKMEEKIQKRRKEEDDLEQSKRIDIDKHLKSERLKRVKEELEIIEAAKIREEIKWKKLEKEEEMRKIENMKLEEELKKKEELQMKQEEEQKKQEELQKTQMQLIERQKQIEKEKLELERLRDIKEKENMLKKKELENEVKVKEELRLIKEQERRLLQEKKYRERRKAQKRREQRRKEEKRRREKKSRRKYSSDEDSTSDSDDSDSDSTSSSESDTDSSESDSDESEYEQSRKRGKTKLSPNISESKKGKRIPVDTERRERKKGGDGMSVKSHKGSEQSKSREAKQPEGKGEASREGKQISNKETQKTAELKDKLKSYLSRAKEEKEKKK